MKKIIKSRVFAFVLGAIIFSGITGVAAYTIFASDIGYTPKDTAWEVDNVKDAIDELYEKKTTLNLIYSDLPTSAYDATITRTTNLNPGKYLLIVTMASSEGFERTLSVNVNNAVVSNVLLNHHQFIGTTNVNMYHAILNVSEKNDVAITLTPSGNRGYQIKNINLYRIY